MSAWGAMAVRSVGPSSKESEVVSKNGRQLRGRAANRDDEREIFNEPKAVLKECMTILLTQHFLMQYLKFTALAFLFPWYSSPCPPRPYTHLFPILHTPGSLSAYIVCLI